MSKNTEKELRDDLLLLILPHVAFDGWSQKAIKLGKKNFVNQGKSIETIFPSTIAELIIHFGEYIDRKMVSELSKVDLQDKPVRERIALSLKIRIELLSPYREQIRRLLSFLALPQNQVLGMKITYNTVNSIWYNAQDTSTDFNFYSKRGLLAGIYGATILYWLSDDSADYRETKNFLERCIDQVMLVPKYRTKFAKHFSKYFRAVVKVKL